jgi:ribosomal protein L14E/L6E/L27E
MSNSKLTESQGRHHSTTRRRFKIPPLPTRSRCRVSVIPLPSTTTCTTLTPSFSIERYPSKVTKRMGKKRMEKRSKVKPFIKIVNYNHLMPTRYTLELEGLKGAVSHDTFKEVSQREEAKKNVKKALEERYTSGKNRWFFTPLRF